MTIADEEQDAWLRAAYMWRQLHEAVASGDMELYIMLRPTYLEVLDDWYDIQQRKHDAAQGG